MNVDDQGQSWEGRLVIYPSEFKWLTIWVGHCFAKKKKRREKNGRCVLYFSPAGEKYNFTFGYILTKFWEIIFGIMIQETHMPRHKVPEY